LKVDEVWCGWARVLWVARNCKSAWLALRWFKSTRPLHMPLYSAVRDSLVREGRVQFLVKAFQRCKGRLSRITTMLGTVCLAAEYRPKQLSTEKRNSAALLASAHGRGAKQKTEARNRPVLV